MVLLSEQVQGGHLQWRCAAQGLLDVCRHVGAELQHF
ncbi:Uncharacterised protein [Vibrio cholerae]|nr:Uncharacterised protein [Vibrio cholerae]CSI56081.1 Uncharacterised protein [Vibrio cholerae]